MTFWIKAFTFVQVAAAFCALSLERTSDLDSLRLFSFLESEVIVDKPSHYGRVVKAEDNLAVFPLNAHDESCDTLVPRIEYTRA